MPTSMIISKITNETTMPLMLMISSEIRDINAETKMVTRKMVTTQRMVLLRSFLIWSGSTLDTVKSPLYFINDGSRQDKSYGLGRVVFHRTEPAVAAQAVPI